ncbi:beta-lactamase superfamily domain-containing protein [Syncephalis fuscata]|nr:beta-lactamase superfamily domain-containing protein [Syncephalis fuscata]
MRPNFELMYPNGQRCQTQYPVTVTWLGQSTCLVQLDGLNILTDPIFSRCTVNHYLGPRRLRPTPCQLSELNVDIVLVSHNHFDHLDINVVKELNNTVQWIVPLGLRDWFARRGVHRVIELDWWQEHAFENHLGFVVTATPLQHWSGRSLFDVNQSLWCGFVIKGPSSSFFHCGDTGYCSAFKEIGQRLGPITLASIPIGSYAPRWYMEHQHIDPDDAAKIHKDIGSQLSIGVHWGTFLMSDEHYMDPPKRLKEAASVHQLGDTFITLPLGETRCIMPSVPSKETSQEQQLCPPTQPDGK